MKNKIIYEKGDKIGNCIFLQEKSAKTVGLSEKKTLRRYALFKCICGKEFETYILNVKNGNTSSCGCVRDTKISIQGKKNITHGQRNHPLYRIWQGMLDRCNNSKNFAFFNYGNRGIKVCDRWIDIDNFIEDMYPAYCKGLEIDRINVNGNYEPTNCRWATRKQNMNNTRRNRFIEYNGEIKTLSQWSECLNIPYKTLIQRLNNWSVEKSFTYKRK